MKKIIFLFILFWFGLSNFNPAKAKEKSCVREGFLYEYNVQKREHGSQKSHHFPAREFPH